MALANSSFRANADATGSDFAVDTSGGKPHNVIKPADQRGHLLGTRDLWVTSVVGSVAAASKWHLELFNAAASAQNVEIVAARVGMEAQGAVAPTTVNRFGLFRTTARTVGTAITPLPVRPTGQAALDANLTSSSNATAVTAAAIPHGLAAVAFDESGGGGPTMDWLFVDTWLGEPLLLPAGSAYGYGIQQFGFGTIGHVNAIIYFRVY